MRTYVRMYGRTDGRVELRQYPIRSKLCWVKSVFISVWVYSYKKRSEFISVYLNNFAPHPILVVVFSLENLEKRVDVCQGNS